MKYKINIHAHTIFSDGLNTPFVMAQKAKELGFTALVITDHSYIITEDSMRLLKKACNEARKILPVIIGLEVPFLGSEVLVFGGAAIQWILKNGKPTESDMTELKEGTGCAVILCHPGEQFEKAAPSVDGYERFNSGSDYFKNDRALGSLEVLPGWCNSDAHHVDRLDKGYNLVNSKIETEHDLIKYIKRGTQPEFFVKGKLNPSTPTPEISCQECFKEEATMQQGNGTYVCSSCYK